MSLEIALALASVLAGSAVANAVTAIYSRLKNELRRKGIDQEKIDKITALSREGVDKIETTDFVIAVKEISNRIGPEEDDLLTLEAISDGQNATKAYRDERMRQAKWSFNAAIVLLVLGVLIIFAGISTILLTDKQIGGVIGTSVGAIVEVVSALLFKFNNDVNGRLDEVNKTLLVLESARVAIRLISKIEDPGKRDDAIRETALSVAMLSSRETG